MRTSDKSLQLLRRKPRGAVLALVALLSLTTALTVLDAAPAEARRGGYTKVLREPASGTPLTVVVSLKEQRLQVFDAEGLVAQSPISSGRPGYSTPTGVFSILQKNREHYSNLYDDAPMPNMQRITWSGVALHAGPLPGYPASHGCIRLPYSFSKSLFQMTQLGTRVIVHDDMVEPERFQHPRLFTALPPGVADIPHPVRPNGERSAEAGGAAAGLGTVSAMLGVTPATAAEAAMKMAARPAEAVEAATGTPPPTVRTRAMALAEREADIARRASLVTQQEQGHAAAADAIADVNGRLKEAREHLTAAKRAEPELKREARDRARAMESAERRLKDFIRQQTREMSRMEERTERRKSDHLADAASSLGQEELLARAARRQADAARDEADRAEAAVKENELEAAYLDAIHEAERAEQFLTAQAGVIAGREDTVRAIEKDLIGARKTYASARNALDAAIEAHKQAVAALKQFAKPATVFISRKTGKLVVRQGFAEVYATPVGFSFPEARIGTHIYTATSYADATETALDWQAITLTDVSPALPRRARRGDRRSDEPANELAPPATAAHALERIDMPEDARQRIAELMKPGSTLIVSDEGPSPETGQYTDVIVQPDL